MHVCYPGLVQMTSEAVGADSRRIWLVGLFFGEGPSPTGVLMESLATALSAKGYPLEVVAGRSAYNSGGPNRESQFRGPVRRLFTGPRVAEGLFGRLLVWGAFSVSVALFATTRRLPDVVFLTTTPPFLHVVFVIRKLMTRSRCQLVIWNQDTYPDILAAVGLLRSRGLAYRLLAGLQSWAIRRVNHVVVLDGAMAELLRLQGAQRITVIPNWNAASEYSGGIQATDGPADPRLQRLRDQRRLLLLYSGNYGWGHDLEPVFNWFRVNPDQHEVGIVLVGGGEKWAAAQKAVAELGPETALVLEFLPRDQLLRLLQTIDVDVGVVSLEQRCAGLMSPSKIHAYLAAGKPLLYLGPTKSNVDDAIAGYQCGVRVGYDQLAALPEALQRLQNSAQYAAMVRGAIRAAQDRHSVQAAAAAFAALLDALAILSMTPSASVRRRCPRPGGRRSNLRQPPGESLQTYWERSIPREPG